MAIQLPATRRWWLGRRPRHSRRSMCRPHHNRCSMCRPRHSWQLGCRQSHSRQPSCRLWHVQRRPTSRPHALKVARRLRRKLIEIFGSSGHLNVCDHGFHLLARVLIVHCRQQSVIKQK
jgi:hypothetical protein